MEPIFTIYNDITGKAVSVFFNGAAWIVPFECMTFEATSLPRPCAPAKGVPAPFESDDFGAALIRETEPILRAGATTPASRYVPTEDDLASYAAYLDTMDALCPSGRAFPDEDAFATAADTARRSAYREAWMAVMESDR